MSITPRGMSVQEAYRIYRDDGLIVNRKYQRKLVWTLSEKENLIDSLLKDYPIPLILLAETVLDGKQVYEIIDGMQRLNAIFSFIENSFSVQKKFFDLSEFARAKLAAEQRLFTTTEKSKLELFDPLTCANILDYQLAITIFPIKNEDQITDVFGRINSGGKQLSSQEKRQAGMTDGFSMAIRELASEIRGDSSKEILPLSEMPEISIESGRNSLGYSLSAEKIFWCYQGILWANNLRDSEDEEMLLDISSSIVLGKPIERSKVFYDKLYEKNELDFETVRREFNNYGSDRLIEEVKVTLSVMIEVINGFSPARFTLRNVVSPKGTNPIKETFYAIFMAFHRLVIQEEKTPENYTDIMNALTGLHSQIIATANTSKSENRIKNIDSVTGLIQRFFIKKDPPLLKHGAGLAIDFENSLRRSRIETNRYECKQGFHKLDEKRDIDKSLPQTIIETICGIANLGPENEGYIFIGVADKASDAERIKNLDSIEPIEVGNRFVVGIERELKISNLKEEQYIDRFLSEIRKSELSEPLKTQVLTQIDYVQYKSLSVIRIRIPSQDKISSVGSNFYCRENSSTIKIEGAKLLAVNALFK